MEKIITKIRLAILVSLLPFMALAQGNLTLQQAEQYALKQAPEIRQLQAQQQAFSQKAIAADQLPDPKLVLGASNVPVDSFDFTQENMTQIQIGLMQQFPKGHSLSIRSQQELLRAQSSADKSKLMSLTILKTVRAEWLNLYYWQHALNIYQRQLTIFNHLLRVTKSMLANNRAQQKDVVRAQFELSSLQQKIIYARQQQAETKAMLSRWLGNSVNKLDLAFPQWPTPPNLKTLQSKIKNHPLLQIDQKEVGVNQQGIRLAKQQYIPGFNLGVVYGIRQGKNTMTEKSRSDFISAKATVDLPIFTHNRQSREVKASADNYVAAEEQKNSDYLLLKSQLDDSYAAWQKLVDQTKLYKSKLVPQANMYAKSTQIAYQNKQTDFPTLARAYIQAYNTEIAALKTKVTTKQERVNLLYLEGR